jgi:hypothetical protein
VGMTLRTPESFSTQGGWGRVPPLRVDALRESYHGCPAIPPHFIPAPLGALERSLRPCGAWGALAGPHAISCTRHRRAATPRCRRRWRAGTRRTAAAAGPASSSSSSRHQGAHTTRTAPHHTRTWGSRWGPWVTWGWAWGRRCESNIVSPALCPAIPPALFRHTMEGPGAAVYTLRCAP